MRWAVEYPRRAAAVLIAAAALALVGLIVGAALGRDPARAAGEDRQAAGAQRALAAARGRAGAEQRQIAALGGQVAQWRGRALRAEAALATATSSKGGKGRTNRRQGRR